MGNEILDYMEHCEKQAKILALSIKVSCGVWGVGLERDPDTYSTRLSSGAGIARVGDENDW